MVEHSADNRETIGFDSLTAYHPSLTQWESPGLKIRLSQFDSVGRDQVYG
jgi:hypothetical protein